jgi:kumamolisin
VGTPTVLEPTPPAWLAAAFARAADSPRLAPLAGETALSVTLALRRAVPLPEDMLATPLPGRFSRDELLDLHGPASAALPAIRAFAAAAGIAILAENPAARCITLELTADQAMQVFGGRLWRLAWPDGSAARAHQGGIVLAAGIAPFIAGVFGLSAYRVAESAVRLRPLPAGAAPPFTPAGLAAWHGLPLAQGLDGKGMRIGVIGFAETAPVAELEAWARDLGLAGARLRLVGGAGRGAPASPGPPRPRDGAASEAAALSAVLQAIIGQAPGAEILLHLATPDEQGCIAALAAAIHDADAPVDILCLPWGGAEAEWSAAAAPAIDALLQDAALLGISVCAASGDHGAAAGSDDGQAATRLPAASPHALACGAAALDPLGLDPQVWNESALVASGGASGGGISTCFAVPAWQAPHNPPLSVTSLRPGRGVPDVAALAAPWPGLLCRIGGLPMAAGGTGIATALWAALLARIGERLGASPGFVAPWLYAQPSAPPRWCRDICVGGNETTGHVGGYFARPGWDPCTGLGTPEGAVLLQGLLDRADPGPGPRAAEPLHLRWLPRPGLARSLAVGADGTLYALAGGAGGPAMRPLCFRGPGGWRAMPGAFGCALAVGPGAIPWVLDAAGTIRHWTPRGWQAHPGRARSLAFDAAGALWIVAPGAAAEEDGPVRRWQAGAGAWEEAGFLAHRLRPGREGPLAITAAGALLRRDAKAGWCRMAEGVLDAAEDPHQPEVIWAISRRSRRIWRLLPARGHWQQVADALADGLLPLPHEGLLALLPDGGMALGRRNAAALCGDPLANPAEAA